MTKLVSIKSFQIKGFRGGSTIKASIEDGVMILVGDNGSGKTTFLRTIFLFLSGKWSGLLKIKFESISISFDKSFFLFTKDDIELLAGESDSFDDQMSLEFHHPFELEMMLDRGKIDFREYRAMMRRSSLMGSSQYTNARRKTKKFKDVESRFEQVKKNINAQILYLPTYRRIERELSSIFEGREVKNISNYDQSDRITSPAYVELVEFGMRDVKNAISKNLEELKEFARKSATALNLGYLGDIVNKGYEKDIKDFSEVNKETIDSVLNRIDESVLNEEHKKYISDLIGNKNTDDSSSEYHKIIRHYFSKLLDFQQDLSEKEKNIIDFCVICSKYMTSKAFDYDNFKFQFSVTHKNNSEEDEIDLSDLSSGEKQIASLFSHLYLSKNKKYFVLIDEPELSLSVSWQKEFLMDIVDSGLCVGLVAVTHSPFIYANSLRKYATSMGELTS